MLHSNGVIESLVMRGYGVHRSTPITPTSILPNTKMQWYLNCHSRPLDVICLITGDRHIEDKYNMKPTIEQLRLANSDYTELRKFMMNKDFVNFLTSETNFLSEATTKQRLFHFLNHITEIQVCKCGVEVKWNIKDNTYRKYCSSKCAHTDESVKLKTEKTCLERFGVKTNLITTTAKDNYSIKMIKRFGVDNPFKSAEVQQDIKDAIFDKYGVDNVSKLDSVKEKINVTHIERYGRIRECQSHFTDESYSLKYNKQALVELYTPGTSIKDIAEKLNVGHSQLCIQFKNLGIEMHQTVGQQQIYDFIKSIYSGEIILNDRKILDGKEIDIYIPLLNVGFEYDGIFWHSQDSSGKTNYHADKDALAVSKGIKLYHILDIEWKTMKELIESRISSIMGTNKTIYGRKTTIKILERKLAHQFFNDNHVQGSAGASFYIGLEFEGNIVAAMSFGKSRYNSVQFELIRFCNVKGLSVVGGASKLFKYAVKHLNAIEIISFCDIRWGTGGVYHKLGFNHIRDNGPSYIYTNRYRTLESRIKYQKHKLEKLLPIFDKNISEWENMKNNSFDRYWNSGNAVYIWTKPVDVIEQT